jgi:hypothetical protein
MSLLTIENRPGKTIRAGALSLTPFVQAVQFRPPGLAGGVSWTRPTSVLVRQADGSETVLPIDDITRRLQIGLLTMGLLGGLFIWLLGRRSS